MASVAIQLTKGKTALIDEQDLPLVSQYKWHAACRGKVWYAASSALRRSTGESLYLHRLIMGAVKEDHVDHIDGDGLNCRRDNMRICTNAQNRMNQHVFRGMSKFKGVNFNAKNATRQWKACISVNDRTVWLGAYDSETDAARAYNAAAVKYYGEFACLNEIPGMSREEATTAPQRIVAGRGPDMKKRKKRCDAGMSRKIASTAA